MPSLTKLPKSEKMGDNGMKVKINVLFAGEHYTLQAAGNGRLDSVTNALRKGPYELVYDFITYSEHALESESSSRAASYVAIKDKNGSWV